MRKKAFTLLEIVVTMLISSLLIILVSLGYNSLFNSNKAGTGKLILSSSILESHKIANINLTAPKFPSNMLDIMKLNGYTFTEGESVGDKSISYHATSDLVNVFTIVTGDSCWIAVDSFSGATRWAIINNPQTCLASNVSISTVISTDPENPTILGVL